MKVVVTVKIIYDLEVKPVADNGILNYKTAKRMIDPIDEANIAAVIKFKEIVPSIVITAICLSKEPDSDLLRNVLNMGVDEVVFVKINNYNELVVDGLTRAKLLKRLLVAEKYDLVLTGKSSSDNNSGFVGSALTTFLGWRQLYCVCELVDNKADQLTARCKLRNRIMTFVVKLPCVLVCEFDKPERSVSTFDSTKVVNNQKKIKDVGKLNLTCCPCIFVVNYVVPNKVRKGKVIDNVDTLMTTLFG
ncbi:Electron transfer flavoprotein small subunit [Candidatus Hodgkinia cicadicola]|uniref:Electron transfer flavoprotein small subunit n=1 Tax=Candidatus Hodgkinia cicadicola TaxID=573658 RepID=A0ABX4MF72_9HYPH|nr:Electron transfer flavoprotein small subunit [Candidatus Hodgkinia cicadicola]PIM96858.1 Electron transfer flavoprotein small subunit [Candidatus Hodgkinia cicadicola]